MPEKDAISVKIELGDQSFRVRIPPEEEKAYRSIARYAESVYQEITDRAVTSGRQAWAMAAFQIASELYECREESGSSNHDDARIEKLIRRIEEAVPSS